MRPVSRLSAHTTECPASSIASHKMRSEKTRTSSDQDSHDPPLKRMPRVKSYAFRKVSDVSTITACRSTATYNRGFLEAGLHG